MSWQVCLRGAVKVIAHERGKIFLRFVAADYPFSSLDSDFAVRVRCANTNYDTSEEETNAMTRGIV